MTDRQADRRYRFGHFFADFGSESEVQPDDAQTRLLTDGGEAKSHVTGPVIFSHPVPQRQLREEGEVVTFRVGERTTGSTWWRESRTAPKQGDVRVSRLEAVCPHGTGLALEPYLDLSGFKSISDWQQAIRNLHGGDMPREGWLYLVVEVDADVE